MDIKGTNVLITGGASGLGRTIVLSLIEGGAKVFVLDIDEPGMEELMEYESVNCVKCDITQPQQIEIAMHQVYGDGRKIHALINNAGVLHSEPMFSLMAEQKRHRLDSWNQVMAVNLTAPFVISNNVIEHMATNRIKGVIINMSSVSARGNPGQTAYSAAKSGLEAMTRVWSKELGAYGIRAVAIAPGFIDTASTRRTVPEKILDDIRLKVPLKKLGAETDIAKLVIAALENDYLNGSVIAVDGGIVL
jgi:3-oxoacyl-[acyl-carrier protein] reductase